MNPRSRKPNILFVLLVAIVSILLPGAVYAWEGKELLAKSEAAMNAPKDSTITTTMILTSSDGTTKERTMLMKQLQKESESLRLIRFLKPAEVKGVAFLSLSDEQMYLFMPAFKKIRRIASHTRNEDFMGSDMSYDDIGNTSFSDDYSAKVIKEEGNMVTMELEPINKDEVDYSRLVMLVNTDNFLFEKIDFYDKANKLHKVMTQELVEQISGYWTAKKMVMTNVQTNHSTTMEMKDHKFDTGLKEKDFSKRKLRKFK